MPKVPDEFDWDIDQPGSRFTLRPALAVLVSEAEWPDGASDAEARAVVERQIGGWLFESQDELGEARAVSGGVGRGAEGWAPVVEWLFEPAVKGMVSAAAGATALNVWRRLRRRKDGRAEGDSQDEAEPNDVESKRRAYVSRGMAVLLAAAYVQSAHDDHGPWELEAVEEPTSVGGVAISELSYTGLEPWVVLLRNRDQRIRYVVIVAPEGDVLGALKTPIGKWELMFLPPPE